MRRGVLSWALLCLAAGWLCGCGQAAAPSSKAAAPSPVAPAKETAVADAKPLFEQSCAKCHPLDKAEGYKGPEAWDKVVGRMVEKHGAEVTPADAANIVQYLNATYPKT